MTDNPKCPWCGEQIIQWQSDEGEILYVCPRYLVRECPNCIEAPLNIWAQIRAGTAAQDALKEIDKYITDIVLSIAERDDTGLLLVQRIREDALNVSKIIVSITKTE